MSDMRPVIFLDIDGPMIPAGMFFIDFHASSDRRFSPVCVAILKVLLEDCDACLVTNSTHNIDMEQTDNGRSIKDALIAAGIPAERFHATAITEYPAYRRGDAIGRWLQANGKRPWVALDDACFFSRHDPNYDRLVLVDPQTGLTPNHFNQAAFQLLGHEEKSRYFPM